jgi:NADH:ubiquinone oxidoreductase subunit E
MLDAFPAPLGDEVRAILTREGTGGAAILPVLEAVQRARGSISDTAFQIAGRALGVRPADLKEMAAASGRFTVERGAAHEVVVCVHKHCRARGALALLDVIGEETGLAPGCTSPGGELRVETVLCVGGCKIGPNVLVDGTWVPGLDPDGMRNILEGLAVARPSN